MHWGKEEKSQTSYFLSLDSNHAPSLHKLNVSGCLSSKLAWYLKSDVIRYSYYMWGINSNFKS
jgi:hypothetical protein